MLTKVISGGQSGADQAGWRAARRFSIPTGGMMPRGFLTEDGPRPEFATLYGAVAHESPEYPPRTRANVLESDCTLLFGDDRSPGSRLLIRIEREVSAATIGKRPPPLRIREYHPGAPEKTAEWLKTWMVGVVNISGNRESKAPGIGAWVEAYLCEVFRLLGHEEATGRPGSRMIGPGAQDLSPEATDELRRLIEDRNDPGRPPRPRELPHPNRPSDREEAR